MLTEENDPPGIVIQSYCTLYFTGFDHGVLSG